MMICLWSMHMQSAAEKNTRARAQAFDSLLRCSMQALQKQVRQHLHGGYTHL